MTHRHLLTVKDCAPGTLVRLVSGEVIRICTLSARGERWYRPVVDGREMEPDYMDDSTPVAEVLQGTDRYAGMARGEEIDPVQGRAR